MMNTVTLQGRVGKLADTRRTQAGKTVQEFSLAVDTGQRDRTTGEWTTDTTWHQVVAFGPLADNVLASIGKGDLVTVTVRPRNDDYERPGGDEEVIAAGFHPSDDRDYEAQPTRRVRRIKWWAEDVAVSLRWATAEISRTTQQTQRSQRSQETRRRDERPLVAA
jgi:single-strand DNA-binding protein